MSGNFTYGSESITFITEILGYIVGIASVTCSLCLIYIAVRNSPRDMGAYKWYIIFNAISCAGFDLIYGLVHPEPVFPLTIVMSGGLLKHWIIPTYMSYFILYAAFVSICGILYSMPLLFLYRYLQTVNSRFLKLFTLGLRSFLLCSAGFCVLFVPPYITIGNVITSQSDLKEFLRVNQPKIYSIAHNRSILGIEASYVLFKIEIAVFKSLNFDS
ncbi:serpentine type 7TM GPCR chemoreceptor srh domain-containing protein [Ditylenchus destructor]|uniref:Serpentine type 7TM GPCR chemoreceptor srh domain-containing protein n=1 Tax=Ditylenchus destructor TaxID=166010 RepID=A0AAD4MF86_9BILA|nr:serpentine type 7TM GPCR chemoreceptor srh domain-containing protein [Ditylenchus destructor]